MRQKLFFALSFVAFANIFYGCMADGTDTIVLLWRSSSSVEPSSSSMPSSSSVGLCAGFVDGTTREHYGKEKEQFCDLRDGKKYVYVKIDDQTWMAENLNYDIPGSSVCYNNDPANCVTYGSLYDWSTAMAVCPSGWRLPNNSEWQKLANFAGGELVAGTELKATTGWGSGGNGQDTYGFSALPGRGGSSDGSFNHPSFVYSSWHTSSTNPPTFWNMEDNSSEFHNFDDIDIFGTGLHGLYSVRCIKGN